MTTAFAPAYRVETDRFVARCWAPEDAPLVRSVIDASDEHLRPWIPFMKDEPRSLADTAARIRRLRSSFDDDVEYRYGMFEPGERVLIGGAGLYKRVGPGGLEIGYWIGRAHNGKGYATEAAAAMVRLAFEVEKVDRVEIHCDAPNEASIRVPSKLGFTHEATLARRSVEATSGMVFDLTIWTMFADQYEGSPASRFPMRAFDCLGRRLV